MEYTCDRCDTKTEDGETKGWTEISTILADKEMKMRHLCPRCTPILERCFEARAPSYLGHGYASPTRYAVLNPTGIVNEDD